MFFFLILLADDGKKAAPFADKRGDFLVNRMYQQNMTLTFPVTLGDIYIMISIVFFTTLLITVEIHIYINLSYKSR